MNLSKEAEEISTAYDRHAGAVRRWIMRHPNATFWLGVAAVVAAFTLGRWWQQLFG